MIALREVIEKRRGGKLAAGVLLLRDRLWLVQAAIQEGGLQQLSR